MNDSAENYTTKDRVKKLIKTYWSIDTVGGYNGIYAGMLAMALFISIITLAIELLSAESFVKFHKAIYLQPVFGEFSSQIMIISIAVLSLLNIYNYKNRKLIFSQRRLFIQFPICRKDILFARYIIFFTASIIPLIDIIALIIINFYIGSIYISSCAGFLIFFYCLWFIIICAYIGYSDSLTKKNKYIMVLIAIFLIFLMLVSLFMIFYNPNQVSGKYIYTTFSPWFAPILKSLSYIGGISGIFVLLASEAIGYYLCCKKPVIRFERGRKI